MERKIGRGFGDLPLEQQVQALRDHVIVQDLLIGMLIEAVQRLGVTFTADGESLNPADDDELVRAR